MCARAYSGLAPRQWETSLQNNIVSHWLGANLESALCVICGIWRWQLWRHGHGRCHNSAPPEELWMGHAMSQYHQTYLNAILTITWDLSTMIKITAIRIQEVFMVKFTTRHKNRLLCDNAKRPDIVNNADVVLLNNVLSSVWVHWNKSRLSWKKKQLEFRTNYM